MKLLAPNGKLYNMGKAITRIPAWAELFNHTGGGSSLAQRYKQSPTAFTCVQIRAQSVSAIPWNVFNVTDGDPDMENPISDSHPTVTLLDEVNPEMNWNDLLHTTESDMNVFGAAFWLKLGENVEKPDAIARLEPGKMQVDIVDGQLVFLYDGRKTYNREEIVYFHTYNPEESWIPLSPLAVCKYSIDIEIQSARYADVFFTNNAIPPVIFQTDKTVAEPQMQKVRRWYQREFKGNKNAHKTGFMDQGLKPIILGYPLKDLDMKELRAEARRDICAALRVPPALAGAWEAANYASSKEQRDSFYEETVIPRAEYIAGVINSELIEGYGENIQFAFEYQELPARQDDKNLEADRIALLVEMGVIKPEVGAVDLGYEEDQAGIGPIQTRIVDEVDVVDQEKSKMMTALGKWEKKACNALAKGKGAQVTFESDYIPNGVNDAIYNKLGGAKGREQIKSVFSSFREE
jgi:HK97 family phage portal protein